MTMRMNVDPNWSFEQARTAQAEWAAAGGGMSNRAPMLVWIAHQELKEYQALSIQGNKAVVLHAVAVCANHELPMPEWLATDYLRAYRTVTHHKVRTWDEAFGSAHRPGEQIKAMARRVETAPAAWLKVRESLEKDPQRALDNTLYEEVAKDLGIGKTLVQEYVRYWTLRLGVNVKGELIDPANS